MSAQTTLDEDAPVILDATCSFAHEDEGKTQRWPAHATIRMDIRPEVKPDIVGDARKTDFPDHSIDEEYIDPPHYFRRGGLETIKRLRKVKYRRMSRDPFTRYGTWGSREEWLDFATSALKEAHRILKPSGRLHIKLTESRDKKMKVEDVLGSGLFDVVEHETTESEATNDFHPSNKSPPAKVHFLTMKPLTATEEAAKP